MLNGKRFLPLVIMLLASVAAFAQGAVADAPMADAFRKDGKIYVVVAVLSIVFIGLMVYLITIDRKVSRLEKQLNAKK